MRLGLALRPGVFSAPEAVAAALSATGFSTFFVPDVSGRVDPLSLALAILMKRSDCRAGSGVVRAPEHSPKELARRANTMWELTNGRAFLGIGSGSMTKGARDFMAGFVREVKGVAGQVPVYVASLREGMAGAMKGVADGIIINFSTYEHAAAMARAFKPGALVFSYLKVFVSEKEDAARRMAAEELIRYSGYPQYSALFSEEGIAKAILELKEGRASSLFEIERLGALMVNPAPDKVRATVSAFNESGVDMVVVYPYFEPGVSLEFKLRFLEGIA